MDNRLGWELEKKVKAVKNATADEVRKAGNRREGEGRRRGRRAQRPRSQPALVSPPLPPTPPPTPFQALKIMHALDKHE